MPPALAAWDARAPRRVAAAALAAALQGVFYWLMLREPVEPTVLPSSPPLEVTSFLAARRLEPVTLPRKRAQRVRPRRTAPEKEAFSPPPVARPITPPQAGKPAAHAPIDWQRALRDEARAQQSAWGAGKRRFGFPQPPALAPAAPQFGWDYASTHRVQQMPTGGLLINLSDRCAVIVYVLPIPVCKIGRMPANGHLFDRLHDPTDDRQRGLP